VDNVTQVLCSFLALFLVKLQWNIKTSQCRSRFFRVRCAQKCSFRKILHSIVILSDVSFQQYIGGAAVCLCDVTKKSAAASTCAFP